MSKTTRVYFGVLHLPDDLGFILFFVLSSFYQRLVCHCFIDVWFVAILLTFGLSSACYDMVLFVVLLWRFICVGAI